MSSNKLPLKILNPTKTFVLGKDKTHIILSSPNTYKAGRVRQVGFENRLYYEYKYCEDNNGQTFYFTLTYADKNLPYYVVDSKTKFPCFDYQHIVWLLNGGFKKKLLREYGTNFKYFVACELGEGKGKRGFANNPHYHILFFLRPDVSKHHKPYIKIDPVVFRSLLRFYWQGFDEDLDKRNGTFHSYRKDSRFGIVKEGKYGIAVTSFWACQYVAKYVMKDIHTVKRQQAVESALRKKFHRSYQFHDLDLRQRYLDTYHKDWREVYPFSVYLPYDVDLIMDNYQCKSSYRRWLETMIEDKIKLAMQEYRNRYAPKTRISQAVGDYALNFLDESTTTPTMLVPGADGNMKRPIGLYYYRKLYTDILKNNEGNPVRILNKKGIEYRCKRLQEQITKLSEEIYSKCNVLDRELYNKMYSSEVNLNVNTSYDEFKELMKVCDFNVYRKYAEYKLVYENRLTAFYRQESTGVVEFPDIDLLNDYRRFLKPSLLDSRYNPRSADYLKRVDSESFLSYSAHPYFRSDLCVFSVFDLLTDYLFIETDDKKEKEFKERRKVEKFHSNMAMRSYYMDKL